MCNVKLIVRFKIEYGKGYSEVEKHEKTIV